MNSNVTLREALEVFNSANAKYVSDRDVSPDAQEFFHRHDIAHVVFGCNTSLVGEGKIKIWTIFGTTLGFWKHLTAYSEASAFSLFRQYSVPYVLKNIAKTIVTMPRVIARARRMTKRWKWSAYETYLDIPLTQIREEFGIEPL